MKQNIITSSCIFTAADSIFFNTYGISFIKSFSHFNAGVEIHFHIMDPMDVDILMLESLPCNYSVSYTDETLKLETVETLKKVLTDKTDLPLVNQVKSAFKFLNNYDTTEKKLYKLVDGQNYRSGRFVALNKLWDGQNIVLCYDVDTICQGPIPIDKILPNYSQGCLLIKGKFVTSLTVFKDNSQLLRDWGNALETYIKTDKISFAFMDQNTFIKMALSYDVEPINGHYCNHLKSGAGLVVTGKGGTKFNGKFKDKINLWKN
tara:strand:+ start:762 stop:1547 length:786 start_codon:yes stop_codon:yes gene_type:complete